MKKTLLSLLFGSLIFVSCRKEASFPVDESCKEQKDNPAGRSYTSDVFIPVNYLQKNCGLIPLSSKSYWIYQDSIFSNGSFLRVKFDTLQFKRTYKSTIDNLVWWEVNINIGLPGVIYSNDSTIFSADYRVFTPELVRDAKKEYSLFEGDSIQYLTSFDDNAAFGKSVKLEEKVYTPAGTFDDCILFEKKAPFFRRDQVFFKPGLGILKYISEEAPMGSPIMQVQQISTLVSYHIE